MHCEAPIRKVAEAIRLPGGEQAVQLKVAEKAVEAYQEALLLQPALRSAMDGLRRAGREATAR